MRFETTANSVIIHDGAEVLKLEAWGAGIRVRSVAQGALPDEDWALENKGNCRNAKITTEDGKITIENGNVKCDISGGTHLKFSSGNKILFEEMIYPWTTRETARLYKNKLGADGFEAHVRFQPYDGEIIHGMGQYRQAKYNLKGCTLELCHRNSQISIPFMMSNRGYGMLWNNPGYGHVMFAENITEWIAESTKCVDYWVCAGSPSEIIEKYTAVTGRPSHLSDCYLGLWQCKLRYRTQEELLTVAREYHRRGIKLDVIVIDFFHWDYQGDWSFDPEFWPDPQAMVDELKSYGTKLMVSVWPTVEDRSKNYREFSSNGYLVRTDRGLPYVYEFNGAQHIFDATNPEAREFAYNLIKKNYGQYGIENVWLDQAEPELAVYDHDNVRYYLGSAAQVGAIYPRLHSQMMYDGQKKDGCKDILHLVRCAWVGSSKYGALVWSGDIESSFREMKVQLGNGLNMGVAGIPYWITDTAGFYGGNIFTPEFKELMVRWFQWAVYLPVLRMHGARDPFIEPLVQNATHGGGFMPSGNDNEIWSFGEEVYGILRKYIGIREGLKPYIRKTADESEANGMPMLRALHLDYPNDENCWKISDQYMFGTDYMVCPVTDYLARERRVYLPSGKWEAMDGSGLIEGKNGYVTVSAPLDYMPVFKKIG